MTKKQRNHVDDLRGASHLAIEATRGVTDLVQAMHNTIGGGPALLGRPLAGPVRAVTALLYGQVRGVTSLVGAAIDTSLAQLAPMVGSSTPGPQREAVLAALNGMLGDYLDTTGSPLAIQMEMRSAGQPLELERKALRAALPGAARKLLVLVHGSSMGDLQWRRQGHDHGAMLASTLGYTPIYLRYNSGLHVSTNGRALAALLEALVEQWPAPVDELAIVGHSMGGLCARSACHLAAASGRRWLSHLRKLVFLGTPHHGAALERAVHWMDLALGLSAYSVPLARLGKIRSAGITDLRYGNVCDEDWVGGDRFAAGSDDRHPVPLPSGVLCFAAAATLARGTCGKQHGDGLVSVDSALGRHPRPEMTLAFPEAHQWVGFGMSHLDLLSKAEVYDLLERWLGREVGGDPKALASLSAAATWE